MTLLLVQMSLVLLITFICGSIAQRLGQAKVVGEIAGGILLGPSVFGRIAPQTWQGFFPSNSFGSFEVLSTVGLVLFLFVIGSQLDYRQLQRRRSTAALSSGLSIFLPFGMALAIAPLLRQRFVPAVASLPFALFLGVSMSITAFPVLARILEERRMQNTPLGTTALLCAAVDDVCAWLLLAVALTLLPGRGIEMGLGLRLLWLGLYLAGMIGGLSPLLRHLSRRAQNLPFSHGIFGASLGLAFASAAATEAIGLHPLFGAFLAGLCFPRIPAWQEALRMRLDGVVSALLLPFFFALTGIRTRLDLLHGATLWFWMAVVLGVAVAGKIGGAVLAARWTGQTWKNAFALGALLNTRGLVELIVLNIAYSAHVFSTELFTMLVAMALLTTMMTTPLLNLLGVPGRNAGTAYT